ncbi:hypothetical protein [Plantactinospora sp. WMMB782]|uniref:hypothetical protein n=1 Tax=Plantactinospora sp. WMMB782 TaxID=3404121 RepID=UPI003B95B1AF
MATATVNLADYVIGDGPCTVYRFPNGHTASVHRASAGRWTIWREALADDTMVPLNADGVTGLLTQIYNLP